jgi:bifunctional DNA-binding transcriptional regulator/antitoxin component of YhaV-PrlF toxin-antitoxin module
MPDKEIRKVRGLVGEHSFTIVLPKKYAHKLSIGKGDFVTITEEEGAIIVRKS